MDDMLTTDYDGCGRCLVGVRRLSRKTDATSSPKRQGIRSFRLRPMPEGTSSRGPMTGRSLRDGPVDPSRVRAVVAGGDGAL